MSSEDTVALSEDIKRRLKIGDGTGAAAVKTTTENGTNDKPPPRKRSSNAGNKGSSSQHSKQKQSHRAKKNDEGMQKKEDGMRKKTGNGPAGNSSSGKQKQGQRKNKSEQKDGIKKQVDPISSDENKKKRKKNFKQKNDSSEQNSDNQSSVKDDSNPLLSAAASPFIPGGGGEYNVGASKISPSSTFDNVRDTKHEQKNRGKRGDNGSSKPGNKSKDGGALGAKNEKWQKGSDAGNSDNKKSIQSNNYPKETNKDKDKYEKSGKKENDEQKPEKSTSRPKNDYSLDLPPNQPQTTNNLNYGSGSKIVILHVAEKPSIAESIAKGLSSNSKKTGKTLPVYELFDVPFPKAPKAEKVVHKVTSVAGHVFSVDFPKQYQSWDSTDPMELFTAPVVQIPCSKGVVKHLQSEAKGVDFIVLWLDCDREGENINFEVLNCTMHLMKGDNSSKSNYDRVYRAYFSAINPSDIRKAYNALGKPDKNQSLSVDARQELDLKVGVAFSRFQTRYFQGRYGDLDSAVLSYGPCQTPTLGFCVQRHIEIETFIPEPYWLLDLTVLKAGRSCKATWKGGRSFIKSKIEKHLQTISDMTEPCLLKVMSVVSREKKQGRPTPLNTIGLLKACSKALGIGPHSAMQIAERLYLQGYLSYPRTESTKYPTSFDINAVLREQSSDRNWGSYVQNLLVEGIKKPKGGVDMGDHPPITPCRPSGSYLSGDMARVYDLVTRHFIASVSHDAVWKSTQVEVQLEVLGDKGDFKISGKQLVSPGFLAIMLHKQYGDEQEDGIRPDDDEDEDEKELPNFTKGELIPISVGANSSRTISSNVSVSVSSSHSRASIQLKESMTTKPSYLTESELISRMEKNGIGTDASISTHIENILKRNYAELITGRRIAPTKLGLVLCQGYHLIDSSLVLPKIRSDIEVQCNRIAKGLAEKDTVLENAIHIFRGKFEHFIKNVDKMDVLFGSSFSKLADVGKPFTRCGLSRRYLQYIVGPPSRLYNKYTESVYPVPMGGNLKLWNESKCPADGCSFELSQYIVGSPPIMYPFCPNCFNNPRKEWGVLPGEGTILSGNDDDANDEVKEIEQKRMGGKSMTLECPLQDGHPLIESLTVAQDNESGGAFIFDTTSGPKFKLVSTRAPTIVHLPHCIEKIVVLKERDEVHNCHLMEISFKPGESPLTNGDQTYKTSYPNDDMLQQMTCVFRGSDRLKASGRGGGRGHGRGRGSGRGSERGRGGRGSGRGGRGRGRGRR